MSRDRDILPGGRVFDERRQWTVAAARVENVEVEDAVELASAPGDGRVCSPGPLANGS